MTDYAMGSLYDTLSLYSLPHSRLVLQDSRLSASAESGRSIPVMASSTAGPSQPASVSHRYHLAQVSLLTPRPVQLSAPQWRQFTFFDLEDVKDADDISQSPRALRVSLQLQSGSPST